MDFQERIRSGFPNFREQLALAASLGGLPPELQQLLRGVNPPPPLQKTYLFESADGNWKISLAKDWISASCDSYPRWESFKEHVMPVIEAFSAVYEPPYFQRIGLRYVNVISRSMLGLEHARWPDLLQPHIASEFQDLRLDESEIDETFHQFLLKFPKTEERVRVRHGLAERAIPNGNAASENVYMLDSDFFTDERTQISHVINRLDSLHGQSLKLFRWCITEKLESAMGFESAKEQ